MILAGPIQAFATEVTRDQTGTSSIGPGGWLMAVAIVSRAVWNARTPEGRRQIAIPTPRLWIHHSADSARGAAGMRSIQNFHMDTRGYADIGYSFVVDNADGTIFEG